MPRSNRFSGYASAEEEEVVICPYNKQHRIPVSQIQQHLATCKKGLQGRNGSDVKVCPYNRNHHVSAAKYDEHLANCPDASLEDNGFERGRFERSMPRKQRNGHDGYDHSPERYEPDVRHRQPQAKQSAFEVRQPEQHTAPKGFKIGKGFGSTKEPEVGNFTRDRSFRNSREDRLERFDDSSSQGGRNKKAYVRSKSNLDEESMRQLQRNAIEQVREYHHAFDHRLATHRQEPHEDFNQLRERETNRFTNLREPPATFAKQHQQQQQHSYEYEAPPVERRGYGRGRPVSMVETMDPPRPGASWSRFKSEPEEAEPEYKEELLSASRDAAPPGSRFKIVKASSVFGPVEMSAPTTTFVGGICKGFSSSTAAIPEEEDWGGGGGGQRTFLIQKASDVFRLDPDHEMGGRRDDGYGSHRGGRDDFRAPRRFEFKHPDEVFSNGQSMPPRFSRPRTPSEPREQKKPELPWPFNRFAENPNLGKRNEENEARNQYSGDQAESETFPKADAIVRKSPFERGASDTGPTSPNGEGDNDDARSYEHSECEVMSNADTVSSGGGRLYKRHNSDSPSSQGNGRAASETSEMMAAAAAAASTAKPKVLSIYEQYEQFGLDDDDLNFLKPAENLEPIHMPDPSMGAIFAHLRNFGVVQSPAFGSSHSSSPYSLAP